MIRKFGFKSTSLSSNIFSFINVIYFTIFGTNNWQSKKNKKLEEILKHHCWDGFIVLNKFQLAYYLDSTKPKNIAKLKQKKFVEVVLVIRNSFQTNY